MPSRLHSDRRRLPRGGRRADDAPGLAPLVMVLEPDASRREVTETVLAMGHFAVAPAVSVEGALAICRTLIPGVIVCPDSDVDALRGQLHPMVVPMVATTSDSEPGDLIHAIRVAVRGRLNASYRGEV